MSVRNYEEYRRQVLDSLGEDYTVEDLRNFERWRLKVLEGLQAISSDPEAIKEAVEDWLDAHPEATTTVADGSITKAKLFADLIAEIDGKADETDLNDLKSDFNNTVETVITSTNILNTENYSIGAIGSNGELMTNGIYAEYVTSDFIELEANTDYYFAIYAGNPPVASTQRKLCLLYDSNKQPISGSHQNNDTQTQLTFNTSIHNYD